MATLNQHIQSAYDQWADIYDTNDNPTRDLNAWVLRKQPLKLQEQFMLELGCGTGLNSLWLAEQAEHLTAVDFSEGMLNRARKMAGSNNIEWLNADITKPWDLPDELFDGIVINLVLEHIEDFEFVFLEANRVLRDGGWLYIGELHPYKQYNGSQAKYEDEQTGEEKLVPAFRHTISDFVNTGLDTGFEIVRLNEWMNDNDDIPRLLTLLYRKI